MGGDPSPPVVHHSTSSSWKPLAFHIAILDIANPLEDNSSPPASQDRMSLPHGVATGTSISVHWRIGFVEPKKQNEQNISSVTDDSKSALCAAQWRHQNRHL